MSTETREVQAEDPRTARSDGWAEHGSYAGEPCPAFDPTDEDVRKARTLHSKEAFSYVPPVWVARLAARAAREPRGALLARLIVCGHDRTNPWGHFASERNPSAFGTPLSWGWRWGRIGDCLVSTAKDGLNEKRKAAFAKSAAVLGISDLWAPLLLALFLLLGLSPSLAQAQPPQDQPSSAAALELYEQGRTALTAGDLPTACARFRASDQLEAAAGARANLGDCEERRGRVAAAWEAYRSALKKLLPGDPRIAKVQARIDAVAARLPRLELQLAPGAPAELVVTEGSSTVGASGTWGIALPFDPGVHTLVVRAPGHAPWTLEVQLVEGKTKPVVVGAEAPPVVAPAGPVAASGALPSAVGPVAPRGPLPGEGRTSVGPWVVGGIGVASLAAAAVLGGITLHESNVNKGGCDGFTMTCSQAARNAASLGGATGAATTVTLIAGAAGVAGGALWLGLRDPAPTRPRVGIGAGNVRVEGSW